MAASGLQQRGQQGARWGRGGRSSMRPPAPRSSPPPTCEGWCVCQAGRSSYRSLAATSVCRHWSDPMSRHTLQGERGKGREGGRGGGGTLQRPAGTGPAGQPAASPVPKAPHAVSPAHLSCGRLSSTSHITTKQGWAAAPPPAAAAAASEPPAAASAAAASAAAQAAASAASWRRTEKRAAWPASCATRCCCTAASTGLHQEGVGQRSG